MKSRNVKTYCGTKCIIEDKESILSMTKENSRDILLSIDKGTYEGIKFDDKFELHMDFKKDESTVYDVINKTYEDLKFIMGGYRNEPISDEEGVKFCSQEVSPIVGNYLVMTKNGDTIRLSFNTQAPIPGYEKDLGSSAHIPIKVLYGATIYSTFEIMCNGLIDAVNLENDKEKSLILKPTKKNQ